MHAKKKKREKKIATATRSCRPKAEIKVEEEDGWPKQPQVVLIIQHTYLTYVCCMYDMYERERNPL